MCYSERASLIAFLTNCCSSFVLYQYNKVLALYMAYVGLMQLYDYIFWTNLGETPVNYITTKVAMVINHLQPIVLALLITQINKTELDDLTKKVLYMYGICVFIYTVVHWHEVNYTVVTEKSHPSLEWKWNNLSGGSIVYFLYLLSIVMLLYHHFPSQLNTYLVFVAMSSFILSYYYYKSQGIGRFWCYFAAYIPLFIVAWFAQTASETV